MSTLALNENEMMELKVLLGDSTSVISKVTGLFESATDSCDKYDCFFRSVQCPCEGICDGKQ